MQAAAHLASTLEQAAPGILQRARPFGLLAEQVVREYGQFALTEPADPAYLARNLWHQLAMIGWYLERRYVIQAVTLAREWVVSMLAFQFGTPLLDNLVGRPQVEQALNNGVERRKAGQVLQPSPHDAPFEALEQAAELCRLWSRLTVLRNDLAHVGMNTAARPAQKLYQSAQALYPDLQTLAAQLLSPSGSPLPDIPASRE
jgi:hypothetical protein